MNFKLALAALLTTSVASVLAAPAPAPNPIAAPAPQTTCTPKGQKCNSELNPRLTRAATEPTVTQLLMAHMAGTASELGGNLPFHSFRGASTF
ncbi:hypothetical protein FS837_002305 [Tulasnella sp. UAMH 9824]|nr:hypothetical protein FS837_002305 [Tulasnella sp. UAMH 9824]